MRLQAIVKHFNSKGPQKALREVKVVTAVNAMTAAALVDLDTFHQEFPYPFLVGPGNMLRASGSIYSSLPSCGFHDNLVVASTCASLVQPGQIVK